MSLSYVLTSVAEVNEADIPVVPVEVAPVDEGFNSSASCVVRLSKSLRALRKAGLSMAQSVGQVDAVSSPSELDLALALSSRDDDEALDSSGGLKMWVIR